MSVDFAVQNHGSIFLFQPLTPVAQEWIDEHISDDASYFGDALVVEHRYVESIARHAIADGLVLR
jgi:hypothetical protein